RLSFSCSQAKWDCGRRPRNSSDQCRLQCSLDNRSWMQPRARTDSIEEFDRCLAIVSSNPKRDRLAMQLNIVLRLTCPQDRDRDAVNAPSCDPFQNVFVVFADSPAIDSDRRPDPSHNIVVHGAQIAVAGDRVLLLGAFSFTDEHWKRIGLLPFIDYSVEQRRSCSCRNLDLSALRMAREQQVPVWEEDERRPCDAVR